MPLAAMIPRNIVCGRFALHEFVLGDDCGIDAPLVCAVHFDVPLYQPPGFCTDQIIRRLEVHNPQGTAKIRLLATPLGRAQDEPDKTIPC